NMLLAFVQYVAASAEVNPFGIATRAACCAAWSAPRVAIQFHSFTTACMSACTCFALLVRMLLAWSLLTGAPTDMIPSHSPAELGPERGHVMPGQQGRPPEPEDLEGV